MQLVNINAVSYTRGVPSCLPASQARMSGFMMNCMVLPFDSQKELHASYIKKERLSTDKL